MGYFPLCVDLTGKKIILVGNGSQIADKAEKLRPFGGVLIRLDTLDPQELDGDVAFVVVGDTGQMCASRISSVCRERGIPVNVVDDPKNSSFFFPSLITRGDLTVSVSTGGKSPGAAADLARKICHVLPEETEEILDWLCELRKELYESHPREEARRILRKATQQAFDSDRCLTPEEIQTI